MQIRILGSGTCVPSLKRYSSSIWVKTEKREFLLDTGNGCVKRLMEAGGDLSSIDTIFLSHFHPDHCADLISILFSLKYGSVTTTYENLLLMGGKGIAEFYNGLGKVFGHWIDCNGKIDLHEFHVEKRDYLDLDDLKIETFPVEHRPESIALKITDNNNKTFVYSGDMDITPSFNEFCKDADVLVIDSATPHHLKKDGHLTPKIAGETAKSAGVKKLVLTHFYPEAEYFDMKKEAQEVFDGEVVLAYDLMEMNL